MDFKEFKDPSALFRPAPFWSWNDRLDGEELKRQIREMADKGWGSYFMHSRVGLVTGYLSDEWMELIRTCAKEAKETGTFAWLYDEDKWPSGFAGGEVPEMSEAYRSRALVLLEANEITEDDTVLVTIKPSSLYAACEDNDKVQSICKRVSPLGNNWFNGASYVDLMSPEAVQAFIDSTHERYREACGEYFGKEIPGMFTDEPCYIMESHYTVPVLPWSDYLPDFFIKLKGYSIEEKLEQLFFDIEDYQKVRFDFFDCATRLFMESFSKKYYEWCDSNNLIMTGHFMAEDNLAYQTQWIGAAMPHYQFMHWPGIDKLGRNLDQLVTVKQVTSVVDQLEKEKAFSEVFGCVGQQVSFFHRKWISDWQAVLGISFVNSHLSLYSMRGERKRDYPANLFYQQPWWDNEKNFSDYLGRLNYAVTRGKREVDILVIHPVSSVWSEYSPLHKQNGLVIENSVYNKPFEDLSKELIANKLDFHYGDEIIMESHARVEGGKLIIGAHSYSTVIVPPTCTLRKNTADLLEKFQAEAGSDRLIFMGRLPERIDGVTREINILKNAPETAKVSTANRVIKLLDEYYSGRVSIIDKLTGRNASSIICQERQSEKDKIVILANTDEAREINAQILIKSSSHPKLVDLMSGKIYGIPFKFSNGEYKIDVKFYPAGSMVLLIDSDEIPDGDRVPSIIDSGVVFKVNENDENKANENEENKDYKFIRDWSVKMLEENVLPLNDVTLYLGVDERKVLSNEPVAKAWHEHFYNSEEGTPFKAEYTFEVLNIPDGNMFAVIEMAENLDSITINGEKVDALKERGELGPLNSEKSWKDINFTKVPLNGHIKKGTNVLSIEGRKANNITGPGLHRRIEDYKRHEPTEIEAVYIVGDFKVTDINREVFMIDECTEKENALNLSQGGYPFYAGRAEYKATFNYKLKGDNEKVLLKLNEVNAACANMYVNGELIACKYWEPFVFDISSAVKDGENTIQITLSTTLFNLMGPNRISGIEDNKWVGPHTFTSFDKSKEQYTILPFGMKDAVLLLSSMT